MTLSLVLALAAPAAPPAAISPIAWGGEDYLRIERRVNGSAEGRQEAPALAMAADGTLAVAWQSREPSGPARLRLRVFDPLGEPSGAERLASGAYPACRSQADRGCRCLRGDRADWHFADRDAKLSRFPNRSSG
ncbi:MAG: hypothetical protein KatS3mg015_0058 [Fimbriimonadales bacterium]|nr:MAG: hypothetical protein KatS3mg015_0058 [Fimbriimonadales bacterium]